VYIAVAKVLGLYKGAVWQASSEHEEVDIRRWFGRDARVIIAPNLPPVINAADEPKAVKCKTKGCLKIIFLSRISRKKNLDGALKMLDGLKGKIQFNIYGPMEDKTYWAECQKIISSLPENIKVKYCGSIAHDKVGTVMREHDIFFLPTLGENFGHVILEALCSGCPVLISDQTLWRGLEEKGVGWDLSLNKPEMFQEVLQRCVEINNDEYVKWSERALEYGLQVTKDDGVVEQNRKLFLSLRVLSLRVLSLRVLSQGVS
jgi:glycosyltransferase involved in cell wall biosynthesis